MAEMTSAALALCLHFALIAMPMANCRSPLGDHLQERMKRTTGDIRHQVRHHHDQRNRHLEQQENAEMQRIRDLVLHSENKVVDFERGQHMDANDEAVRQYTWWGPADNYTLQRYVERNCTTCLLREEAKLNRIERIKEDLLQKLGIKLAPNWTNHESPPALPNLRSILSKWGFSSDSTMTSDQAMAADQPYQDLVETPLAYDEARTERIYAFATKAPMVYGLRDDVSDDVAYFRFSSESMNNDVAQADLHVHINRPSSLEADAVLVLNLKMDIFTVDDLNGKLTLVHSKQIKRNYRRPTSHWEKADVTKYVQHWFRKPERNYGFVVRVMYKDENLANVPKFFTIQGDNQIYLEVVTKDGAQRRSKRSPVKMDCTERDNETRCCRYPLVLDFESFGWDWVIAPKKYLAYYCSGECPFQHLQRYVHTHLVQQANPRVTAGPCCYPTDMAPILMVYFSQNKEVLVSMVPGMVVTRCGCA